MYQAYPLATQQPKDRFAFFQSVVEDVFCPMEVQPRVAAWQTFSGSVEVAHLGSVGLARVATSACMVRRRRQDIQRIAEAPYLVKFQSRGESLWSQRDREVHLHPGDFVVCSTAEPYSLQFFDSFEMPVLAIRPEIMKRLTPDPEQFLGIRFCGQEADCGLLSSFVAQVASRIGALQGPMIRRAEANIIDLLGGVLTARAQSAPLSAAQHLALIKAYIAEHLGDRDLSPASVARAFRVSSRYIHTLFESEPITVGRYIRSLRVAACRRALGESGNERHTLTELAVTWGFYDHSHMSRAFREELGMTPSEVRESGTGPNRGA
jgi:AraC-like DNA-binding protein